MEKHSVNLVIKKGADSPTIAKLRLYLPITAVAALIIFVILFLASIIYINNNNNEYKALNAQIDILEKKISANKNTEGIYTLTVIRIKAIDQLLANNKNFVPILSEIGKLGSDGITISQTIVDKKNMVTMSVASSSSAALDGFVSKLLRAETSKLFSDIKSSGVVRDKIGVYLLTVSLKPSSTLLQ